MSALLDESGAQLLDESGEPLLDEAGITDIAFTIVLTVEE